MATETLSQVVYTLFIVNHGIHKCQTTHANITSETKVYAFAAESVNVLNRNWLFPRVIRGWMKLTSMEDLSVTFTAISETIYMTGFFIKASKITNSCYVFVYAYFLRELNEWKKKKKEAVEMMSESIWCIFTFFNLDFYQQAACAC